MRPTYGVGIDQYYIEMEGIGFFALFWFSYITAVAVMVTWPGEEPNTSPLVENGQIELGTLAAWSTAGCYVVMVAAIIGRLFSLFFFH